MNLRTLAVSALAIAIANADAGVHEEGGPNMGDQVNFWQHLAGGIPGESWCDDYVYGMYCKAWCVANGLLVGKSATENRAIMLTHADAFSADTHLPRTGYCPTSADKAKKQGRFHGRDFMPSPGDQVLFDFHGQGEPHHTALVVSVNSNGTINTVEGNTSASGSGSQSNGDGVYRKVRSRSHIYGFVHLE